MNIKKKTILTSIMILFVFSSFSLATAAEGWILEEGDNFYYYIEIKEDGTMLAKGIVGFVVDDIAATTIRFSITPDFSGSAAIDYNNLFEEKDDLDWGGSYIVFSIFTQNPGFFLKEDYVGDLATLYQARVNDFNSVPDNIVNAKLESSEWYYKVEKNGTDYLLEKDLKYTPEGILKLYKYLEINDDSTSEKEIFIERSILPFKSPIAVPNLYIFIAAGALGLIVIVIISAIFRKKKR
ncbi:MAG: hypothetical protein ACTSRK_20265 [Promethearchaeota archaeon]